MNKNDYLKKNKDKFLKYYDEVSEFSHKFDPTETLMNIKNDPDKVAIIKN